MVHTGAAEQASMQQGGSMARPPKRKMMDATFRCENGHSFTKKVEHLGHDAGEEAGSKVIK
jgi:hypothetical protein